jgi:nucleoside-diphosphate-sugar epimerase
MRVAIIGGTGHIGSYLTPMLFEADHSVICVCRKMHKPWREHVCWESIAYLQLDRAAEEQSGTFGDRIAGLGADVVIDLTCYYPPSAEQLANALRDRVGHLLHCGTIWVHGHSIAVPTTEDQPRHPFGEYGMRKAAIEDWLLRQSKEHGFPVTVLHPGHLVGPGWAPINPQGNFNLAVFSALRHGEEVCVPNFGMETVHHVHAEDVARAFVLAIDRRNAAVGESFHVVSSSALTLRGYAEQIADWFQMPARTRLVPWEEWRQLVTAKDAAVTEDHIRHSPNCSIEKARRLLGYEPAHSSLQAIQESVSWLIDKGQIS